MWVLGLDSDSHDWADGVLHASDGVGVRVVRDGSGFHEVLVDTNEADGVTAGYVRDEFDCSAHHEHGTLDGLLVELLLSAWLVVGTHDSDLLSG